MLLKINNYLHQVKEIAQHLLILEFCSVLQEIVKEIMRTQFSNSKMKITEDVLSLINDISKAIVVEAAIRAAKQATVAGKKRVQLEHVEAILPQMVTKLLYIF